MTDLTVFVFFAIFIFKNFSFIFELVAVDPGFSYVLIKKESVNLLLIKKKTVIIYKMFFPQSQYPQYY